MPNNETRMTLRVLTLNVWNDRTHPERVAMLRDGITRLDADLICLQEVEQGAGRDDLATLVPGSELHWFHDSDQLNGPTMGTAIATRWRPREVRAHRLPSAQPGPTVLEAVVPLPIGVDVLFLGVKPSYQLTGEAERCAQARAITELEEANRQAAPTVIAGDFDASPDHDSMRYYVGKAQLDRHSVQFRDAWTHAGDGGPGYTWTTANQWVAEIAETGWVQTPHQRRIDYILFGSTEHHPGVRSVVTSCRVVLNDHPAPSDHFGVLAEMQLTIPTT